MSDHHVFHSQSVQRRTLQRRLRRASLAAAVVLCAASTSSATDPSGLASGKPAGSEVQLELLPPLPLQIGRLAPNPSRGVQLNPHHAPSATPAHPQAADERVQPVAATTMGPADEQPKPEAAPVLLRPAATLLTLRPISAPLPAEDATAAAPQPAAPQPAVGATGVAFVTPADPPRINGEGGTSVVRAAPPSGAGISFSISDDGVSAKACIGEPDDASDDLDGTGIARLAAPPQLARPSIVAAPVTPLQLGPAEPEGTTPSSRGAVAAAGPNPARPRAAVIAVPQPPGEISPDLRRKLAAAENRKPHSAATAVTPAPVDSKSNALAKRDESAENSTASDSSVASKPRAADESSSRSTNAPTAQRAVVRRSTAAPGAVPRTELPAPNVQKPSSSEGLAQRPSAAPADPATTPARSAATDRQPVVIAATTPPQNASRSAAVPAPKLIKPSQTLVIEVPRSGKGRNTPTDVAQTGPHPQPATKTPAPAPAASNTNGFAVPATAVVAISGNAQPNAAGSAFAARPSETISLQMAETQTITPRYAIHRVRLEDRGICEAVLVGPYKLLLIGRQNGTTRLSVWSDNDSEPSLYDVEVVSAQMTPAGSSLAAVAGRLTETISATYSNSQVRVVVKGDGLSVVGRVSSQESAREIMRLVRRACLTSVDDHLEIR